MTNCAPRAPQCKRCDIAKDQIEELLIKQGVRYDIYVGCYDETGPMDLHVTAPTQSGLNKDIKISFQNNDELWLHAHGFSFQKYPSQTIAGENFLKGLEDFLTGRSRIIERVGKASGKPRTARWEIKKGRTWLPIAVDILSWRALSLTPYIEYMYTNEKERVRLI